MRRKSIVIFRQFSPWAFRTVFLFLLFAMVLTSLGLTVFAGQPQSASNGSQSLSCSLGPGGVVLQWGNASSGNYSNPTGYLVYRASSVDGPFQQVGMLSFPNGTTQTGMFTYIDRPGQGTWYYQVSALNLAPAGESNPSNECEAIVVITPTSTSTPTISPTPVAAFSSGAPGG